MNAAAILNLVLQYGPSVVDLIARLRALQQAGDKPLTDADFADLQRLASKTSVDYLREATITATQPTTKN